jgi:hypothetical protein
MQSESNESNVALNTSPMLANNVLMVISLTYFSSTNDDIFLYVSFCHKSLIKT